MWHVILNKLQLLIFIPLYIYSPWMWLASNQQSMAKMVRYYVHKWTVQECDFHLASKFLNLLALMKQAAMLWAALWRGTYGKTESSFQLTPTKEMKFSVWKSPKNYILPITIWPWKEILPQLAFEKRSWLQPCRRPW